VGEQMNAMSVIYTMLVDDAITPYTTITGGSSVINVNGGSSDSGKYQYLRDITTPDKVGAGIVTSIITACLVAELVFMNLD
jgi:mannan endo-1,6-alpha-mannosidase